MCAQHKLKAGILYVNQCMVGANLPGGGWKISGIGREGYVVFTYSPGYRVLYTTAPSGAVPTTLIILMVAPPTLNDRAD